MGVGGLKGTHISTEDGSSLGSGARLSYLSTMHLSHTWLRVTFAAGAAGLLVFLGCSSDSADDAGSSSGSAGSSGTATSSGSGTGSSGASGTSGGGSTPPPVTASSCTWTDETSLVACVDKQRYVADVSFLGSDLRTPGSPHWQASADYCKSVLEAEGFTVEVQSYGTGKNVIGTRQGTTRADEYLVLGAHYDHIAGCNGADDNASGVAGVLEAARALSGGTLQRSLAVACWDEEERGELGSKAWAKAAKQGGRKVAQYVNFDMIGYASSAPNSQQMPAAYSTIYREQYSALQADQFRGNFLWTFYDKSSQPFARTLLARGTSLGRRSTGIQVPTALLGMSSLQSSDHAAFWEQGWPAAHVGDTGELRNANYHCKNGTADTLATLDHDYAYDVIRATVAASAVLLSASEPALDTAPNVGNCAQFCARSADFDAQTQECLVSVFSVLGVQPPASCGSVTGPASCNTCVSDLGIDALQCEGLADLCLR